MKGCQMIWNIGFPFFKFLLARLKTKQHKKVNETQHCSKSGVACCSAGRMLKIQWRKIHRKQKVQINKDWSNNYQRTYQFSWLVGHQPFFPLLLSFWELDRTHIKYISGAMHKLLPSLSKQQDDFMNN